MTKKKWVSYLLFAPVVLFLIMFILFFSLIKLLPNAELTMTLAFLSIALWGIMRFYGPVLLAGISYLWRTSHFMNAPEKIKRKRFLSNLIYIIAVLWLLAAIFL